MPELPPINQDLYQALRDDIARRGILVPLMYDSKTGRLVDGAVRLKIAEELGIASNRIPKLYLGNLSSAERDEYRLALNGLRRHLTRVQLQEVIAWTIKKYPEASNRAVASKLGVSHNTVNKVRAGGQVDQLDKRTGRDGKQYPATKSKPMVFTVNAAQSREAVNALNVLGDDAPDGVSSLRKLRRVASEKVREEEYRKAGATLPGHFEIIHSDFRYLGEQIATGSCDLVLSDPPWHESEYLRQPFGETVARILRPGGFAAIYTGHRYMPEFLDSLIKAGLTYRWMVACVNDDNLGDVRNNGSVFTCWRPIVVLQKGGDFRTHSLIRDLMRTKVREKDLHPWQQALEESVMLVNSLSAPGALIADICSGSFTVAHAVAKVGGGRRFIGCEIRKELCELGRRRVHEALKERQEQNGEPLASGVGVVMTPAEAR
jgi:tRNA1(Val) A37 N6-methylase TrmN6